MVLISFVILFFKFLDSCPPGGQNLTKKGQIRMGCRMQHSCFLKRTEMEKQTPGAKWTIACGAKTAGKY